MKVVIESEHFVRTLRRMTHEIIEKNDNLNDIILVGIEKKGIPYAKEIQKLMYVFEGVKVPLETLNIDFHRDDDKKSENVNFTFSNNINGKVIILVDDVLYTGRSVRAAMDAVMDVGRPSKIMLAVFVDRGHRELPIRADFIGKNIPTSKEERVICDFDNKNVIIV